VEFEFDVLETFPLDRLLVFVCVVNALVYFDRQFRKLKDPVFLVFLCFCLLVFTPLWAHFTHSKTEWSNGVQFIFNFSIVVFNIQ